MLPRGGQPARPAPLVLKDDNVARAVRGSRPARRGGQRELFAGTSVASSHQTTASGGAPGLSSTTTARLLVGALRTRRIWSLSAGGPGLASSVTVVHAAASSAFSVCRAG